MNSQQARALVTETFPQTFDKTRFRNFTINLLKHIDESKAQAWNTTYIKDAFKDHVSRFERLGTYTSPDGEKLDVLIVHLTAQSKLERARTAIRNFVADHLKTRDGKDAALVAFVSPTEKQWRFSYVKMEYAAVEKEDGKVGVQTKLTPARRSSYIVGEGESCHTAQSRFLDLLKDTENHPTLAQIEDAFSVEAVTKEFFEQYKALFLDLKDELDDLAKKDKTIGAEFATTKVNTADFAKKLMGQIVFLYFLQKKGWLGVPKGSDWGDGPHNFVRQLLGSKFGGYKNFFNDVLEPLFYDTLATDRGHEAMCKIFNCRIPFLNGGLFEPLAGYDWQKTDIIIPNSLFSNTKTTKVGDEGTGILDVFDRYNFTVNEAEPLEKEVAIDPEMLGKVFENLLGVKERKSKGSFYTPREIVHYMCQESLINYLDTTLNNDKKIVPRKEIGTLVHLGEQISHYEAVEARYAIKMPKSIEQHARVIDDKLADIAVCDPAIGSGAFPVGMMQEIVRARAAITPYFNDVRDRTAYHFKRHAIQNCLYGVDIDPGAVEIAKLRLWLSLVVDEDDVKQIKPLPNLDYKIVTGNSLLSVEKNLFNADLFRRLEELKPRYFDATDRKQKEKLKHGIDDLIHELTNGKEAFDSEIYFSEVMDKKRRGGFDAVIGNPPYVRQESIKELKSALKAEGYECFDGVADLLVYFYERGVKLLREGGTIALITSNKFYRAGYGEKLRGFLARELTLHRLIDFGDAPLFEAIAYASILVGVRDAPARDASALAYTWEKEMPFERIAQIVPDRGQQIRQIELKPDGWRLESPAVFRLLEKLRRAGKPLGELPRTAFFNGIKTGLNPAFVLRRTERDAIVSAEPEAATLFKPFLRGRDVKRWRVQSSDLWLLYLPWHFPLHSDVTIRTSSAEAEKAFKAQFPIVHKHLKRFSELLKKRDTSEVDIRYEWYALSRPRFESAPQFSKPKVVIPTIVNDVEYAVDREGYFSNDKTTLLACENPEFITALLNSKPLFWFMRQTAAQKQGGFYEFKPMYVSALPIPAVPTEQQKPVERLVERILMAKQRDAKADVSALEREIDELVYALYGLTQEEIALVQAAAK
jgi:type I restriction-modification system DNA methylase subunit